MGFFCYYCPMFDRIEEYGSGFTVKTPSFEGPLDLLLDLIEKRKLSISEVSLSKVADDYIAHVKSLSEFPISMTAHFILVASTLLLIKSRSLLPSLQLSEEEQGSIDELERRLKLYKRARELSRHIRERFGKHIAFSCSQRVAVSVFSPDKTTTLGNLSALIRTILRDLPKVPALAKAVVQKVISLEEMIDRLTERIKTNLKIGFREFALVGKAEKVTVIVSFLAMLELVKQGVISVQQQGHFDEIMMETGTVDVPRYT